MTLPVGVFVKINPSGCYPDQGKDRSVPVIGKVVQNKDDEDWVKGWSLAGFDVKVRWPYQTKDKFSLYKSNRDLLAQKCEKTFKDFL